MSPFEIETPNVVSATSSPMMITRCFSIDKTQSQTRISLLRRWKREALHSDFRPVLYSSISLNIGRCILDATQKENGKRIKAKSKNMKKNTKQEEWNNSSIVWRRESLRKKELALDVMDLYYSSVRMLEIGHGV